MSTRILIEGGRATGIALADGRTVRARQFVASTIDVHQTFETMIGREQLPEEFRRKLEASNTRLDAVRLASGAARKPALYGGGASIPTSTAR